MRERERERECWPAERDKRTKIRNLGERKRGCYCSSAGEKSQEERERAEIEKIREWLEERELKKKISERWVDCVRERIGERETMKRERIWTCYCSPAGKNLGEKWFAGEKCWERFSVKNLGKEREIWGQERIRDRKDKWEMIVLKKSKRVK